MFLQAYLKKHQGLVTIAAILINIIIAFLIPKIPNPQHIGNEIYLSRFFMYLALANIVFAVFFAYIRLWLVVAVLFGLILLNLFIIGLA